jgi:hypothetical protein
VPKKVLKKLEVELRDLEVRLRDIWIGTRDPYLSIVLLVLDSRDPYRVFHSDQQLFRRLLGKKSTRRGGTFGPNRKKRSDAGTTGARKKRSDAGIKRGPNKRTTKKELLAAQARANNNSISDAFTKAKMAKKKLFEYDVLWVYTG